MKTAKFNARYYREAKAFVSQEQTRYTLCAIHIEPHPVKGVVIVATDGHKLAIFHDKIGECSEPMEIYWKDYVAAGCGGSQRVIVVSEDVVGIYKIAQFSGYELHATPAESRFLDLVCGDDVKFPNWKAAIPKPTENESIGFNPMYLAELGLEDERNNPISLFIKDKDSQVVTTLYQRDDFVGILMPVNHPDPYPKDFLSVLRCPAEEAKEGAEKEQP